MSGDPLLTCVLIFLDGERFINEAIRSVVGQTGFDDWELLLVDDGSHRRQHGDSPAVGDDGSRAHPLHRPCRDTRTWA